MSDSNENTVNIQAHGGVVHIHDKVGTLNIHGDAEVHLHQERDLFSVIGDPDKQAKRVIDVLSSDRQGRKFQMILGDSPVITQTVTLEERVENAYAHLRARLIQGDLIITNKYFDRDDTYNVEEYIKKVLREIIEGV